jgi:DNA polymerase-3 subunit alpha
VGQALVQGDEAGAADLALRLAACFRTAFTWSCSALAADDEAHVAAAVQLAARLNLPVVATHPVQFATEDDYEAHEARVCIAEGEILGKPAPRARFTREQYFKSSAQMQALFADMPSALPTRGNCQALQPDAGAGQAAVAGISPRRWSGVRMTPEEYFPLRSHEGLEERLAAPVSRCEAERDRNDAALRGAAGV